jgi:hypothetical protein
MVQAEYVTSAIRTLITGGSAPSTNAARTAYAGFIADLSGHPPRSIPLNPDAVDLKDRVDHLNRVLTALSAYLTAILDDTAQNVPGGLGLRQIDALPSDLGSDVIGTLQRAVAVEGVVGSVA